MSRGLDLSHGSNSLNSASGHFKYFNTLCLGLRKLILSDRIYSNNKQELSRIGFNLIVHAQSDLYSYRDCIINFKWRQKIRGHIRFTTYSLQHIVNHCDMYRDTFTSTYNPFNFVNIHRSSFKQNSIISIHAHTHLFKD